MIDAEEIFKDHVAVYERLKGNLETLKWRNPQSGFYAIYYVAWGGTLMVFGDCYTATYQWCPEDPIGQDEPQGLENSFLNWIANRTTLDYFTSKCKAEPRDGLGLYYWTEDQARETISNILGDIEMDDDESTTRQMFEETKGWDSMCEKLDWDRWVERHAYNVFGTDYWDDCRITDPGKTRNICVYLHLEGLKRAMAQVRAKLEAEAPAPTPAEVDDWSPVEVRYGGEVSCPATDCDGSLDVSGQAEMIRCEKCNTTWSRVVLDLAAKVK